MTLPLLPATERMTTLAGVPRLTPVAIGAVLAATPNPVVTTVCNVEVIFPVTAKSSTKVTAPSEAMVTASVLEATPIVPPSLILISSLKVTIPAESICIASVAPADPIFPSLGTKTPASPDNVIEVASKRPTLRLAALVGVIEVSLYSFLDSDI